MPHPPYKISALVRRNTLYRDDIRILFSVIADCGPIEIQAAGQSFNSYEQFIADIGNSPLLTMTIRSAGESWNGFFNISIKENTAEITAECTTIEQVYASAEVKTFLRKRRALTFFGVTGRQLAISGGAAVFLMLGITLLREAKINSFLLMVFYLLLYFCVPLYLVFSKEKKLIYPNELMDPRGYWFRNGSSLINSVASGLILASIVALVTWLFSKQ